MKLTYRYKSVIVPYAVLPGNDIRFILFKDTNSGDWTFVSGGCKQREDPYICATRELFEESKRKLVMSEACSVTSFVFDSLYRPRAHVIDDKKRNLKIVTRHVVYLVHTPFTTLGQLLKYQQRYRKSVVSRKKKEFNETTDVMFATLGELSTSVKMWEFMQYEVVPLVVQYFDCVV